MLNHNKIDDKVQTISPVKKYFNGIYKLASNRRLSPLQTLRRLCTLAYDMSNLIYPQSRNWSFLRRVLKKLQSSNKPPNKKCKKNVKMFIQQHQKSMFDGNNDELMSFFRNFVFVRLCSSSRVDNYHKSAVFILWSLLSNIKHMRWTKDDTLCHDEYLKSS